MSKSKSTPATKPTTTSAAPMSVVEAGRKGGEKVRDTRGHEFYEEIGRKGGGRMSELVAAGKKALAAEAKNEGKGKKAKP